MMHCVSVSFMSDHHMSIQASSLVDQPKHLVKHDEASSSAHPQCEEEGLKCNPSSSGVLIAEEEIVDGLAGWRACLPTPQRQHYTHNQREQGPLDMNIESFVRCPTNDNFTFSINSSLRVHKIMLATCQT